MERDDEEFFILANGPRSRGQTSSAQERNEPPKPKNGWKFAEIDYNELGRKAGQSLVNPINLIMETLISRQSIPLPAGTVSRNLLPTIMLWRVFVMRVTEPFPVHVKLSCTGLYEQR